MNDKVDMKSENQNIEENSAEVDSKPDVSRREFLAKSTGTLAAAGAIAAGAGASLLSEDAKANWPAASDESIPSDLQPVIDVDPAERFRIRQGDLYYEKDGFTDRDVTSWKGRYQYGITVGIIQLPANIPMIPGDMGNATSFPFPVLYEVIPDIDPFWVLSDKPHPEVLKRTIIASHRLEMQGCRAVIGNCGFFANYQPEVSRAITIPFYNGALMQVPMVLTAVGDNKKVGIITANAKLLIPSPALKNSGVREEDMERLVIVGNEDGVQMNKVTGETGQFNPAALRDELVALATKMADENPDLGAIVLECTEFPPYAHAIQEATRLPTYDFITMTKFMHEGAMQKPYTGWL
jgi:hypothetical protein